MDMRRGVRPAYLIGFLGLIVVVAVPLVIRWAAAPSGPAIVIVDATGHERTVTLRDVERLPRLCRQGSYENQFGNWRDEGDYCGVLLEDLIASGSEYGMLVVIAEDGYRIEVERWRVEDSDYPIVLAFSLDGRSVPDWPDGYRIAVLPEDGGVSNAEYGAESAGSYWVKNVARLVLRPE
jgi:hypothetical protein